MKKKWKFTNARRMALNEARLAAYRQHRIERLHHLVAKRIAANRKNQIQKRSNYVEMICEHSRRSTDG